MEAYDIQAWQELLNPYNEAVEELKLKFSHLSRDYKDHGLYSPIEQVDGRVKSISSIMGKLERKGIDVSEVEERLVDIAGIRIICQFVEDIYRVVDLVRSRKDMEVRYEKDYITSPKESGYRSYHMIVYYTVHTLKGPKRLKVEIQIRTLAMNFWATVEHSLQYKYKTNIPEEIADRLSNAAGAVQNLDKEMSLVRDAIMEAEQETELERRKELRYYGYTSQF